MFIHCANSDPRMIGSTLEIEAKYLSEMNQNVKFYINSGIFTIHLYKHII